MAKRIQDLSHEEKVEQYLSSTNFHLSNISKSLTPESLKPTPLGSSSDWRLENEKLRVEKERLDLEQKKLKFTFEQSVKNDKQSRIAIWIAVASLLSTVILGIVEIFSNK